MKTFTLEIKTLEKRIFLDRVLRLTAAAVDGEVGILPDHARFASVLKPGTLRYALESGEERKTEIGEGFLIVNKNLVSVLVKR
ncbi:MAG: hypothetical protein PHG97_04170 [Candidatus Margulisbacteria bacterium]|nr:hypothetical protein [Candidatus Margulisiibacteriota bacterium]